MNMDTNLVIRAMKNAYVNAKGLNAYVNAKGLNMMNRINANKIHKTNQINGLNGLIFHSDLGTQYTSRQFNALLKEKGIIHSYSKKGTPYDNAKIESFHSIIKKWQIYVNRYKSFNQAKIRLFEYIEHFYNRKRIHSSIGYMTPQEKEDEALRLLEKSQKEGRTCIA